MYVLYLSDTCPKGVQAQEFLDSLDVDYQVVNVDRAQSRPRLDKLWELLRQLEDNPQANLVLPVLTQVSSSKAAPAAEEVVTIGFETQSWVELFAPGKQKSATTGAK